MPSTITSFYTFSAGSKARSSQVNVNFSNYRGDLLPINEDTITASDSTHHLGGPDHRWNKAYVNLIDFKSSTTGAGLILVGDTTNTTGAWKFQINSVTVAEVKADGIPGSSMQNSAMQLFTTTITASGSWSVPAGVSNIMVWLLGGGGGGAANSASVSGAGGNGAYPLWGWLAVTASEVLSITCGPGGSGGSGGGNNPGQSGTSTQIFRSGTSLMRAYGAAGGAGVSITVDTFPYFLYYGGNGNTANVSGTAGVTPSSKWQAPGMNGTGGTGGAGGGGGGAAGGSGGGGSYGNGGNGQPGQVNGSGIKGGNGGYGAGGAGANACTGAGPQPGGDGGGGIVMISYIKP